MRTFWFYFYFIWLIVEHISAFLLLFNEALLLLYILLKMLRLLIS